MADFRGQILFENIAKTYPTDANVECSYVMKTTHNASAYDWIGLFKVGWSSVKDVVSYMWVPLPDRTEGEEWKGAVVFQSKLPKEDGEFYQFAYFNGNGKMCGASSPFQFRAPRCEDFVEEEMLEDEDMLFITTRQTQLEEKLNSLEEERKILSATCETLTAENAAIRNNLKENEALRQQLLKERDTARDVVKRLKTTTETMSADLDYSQQQARQLEQRVAELVEGRNAGELQLEKQAVEIRKLQNQVDQLNGQVENLRREKQLLCQHANAEELSKQQVLQQVELLKKEVGEKTTETEYAQHMQVQLLNAQQSLQDLEQTILQQKELIASQSEELKVSKARQAKTDEELTVHELTMKNLSGGIEAARSEAYACKQELKELQSKYDMEKKDWNQTLVELTAEKNHLLSNIGQLNHYIERSEGNTVSRAMYEEQEDRYTALQTAYTLVKTELGSSEKELAMYRNRAARLKDADKHVKVLQDKLAAGERNWKRANRISGSVSESESTDAPPANKPPAAAAGASNDLTKAELQTMVEQLQAELELKTQKKDKYKVKYLEEKQRAATMRDYYKGEVSKQRSELQLARSQLDQRLAESPEKPTAAPADKKAPESANAAPGPAPGPKRQVVDLKRVTGDKLKSDKQSGALEKDMAANGGATGVVGPGQSIFGNVEDDLQLPAPMKPARVLPIAGKDDPELKDQLRVNLGIPVTNPTRDELLGEPRATGPEVLVFSRHDDSDEDNEGYHDARDVPASMDKCCVCDKVFDATETQIMRNEHVNSHYDQASTSDLSSLENHKCPICNKLFPKCTHSVEYFQEHVDTHFCDSNY